MHHQPSAINFSPVKKTCYVICGPTAVGKTTFAIRLAQQLSTEIISADSRQCFRELTIGTAKPTAAELSSIKHYFINSHSVKEEVNAATFESYALNAVDQIFQNHDNAVMVGGTGLYIRAFCEGMDEIPAIDAAIRESIVSNYNNNGIGWLQQQVQQQDEEYYKSGEIYNPQRLMRALEVKLGTGQSIISFQQQQKKDRSFYTVKIGLELPRELLYERINQRVDLMMQDGLLEEVESLQPDKNLNALQTVGYKELFDYLKGITSLVTAVELVKQNTRRYAKRQMTWFKKDPDIQWFSPDAPFTFLQNSVQ